MPIIPTYEAHQPLDAAPTPQPRLDDSIGAALTRVGTATMAAAARYNETQERKARFDMGVSFRKMDESLNQSLIEAERNAPADGSGVHENFVNKVLRPQIDAAVSGISDPKLREEAAKTGELYLEKYSNESANTEWKISNGYSKGQVEEEWNRTALGINENPTAVQGYVEEMSKFIDNAPNLTAAERLDLKNKIKASAPAVVANALKLRDPEALYFASGAGSNDQRISFLTKRLVPAVQATENGPQDPTAISPDGAIGLMQVTLDAAEDVAKSTGDKAFLGMSKAEKIAFLQQPDSNVKYGSIYLDMKVKEYGGDVEAALIAYNAGSGNADKWLKAGRDYSVLPRRSETEPYVQKVMANLGPAALASGKATTPGSAGARIPTTTGTQPGRQPLKLEGTRPEVIDKWELVQGAFGRAVPVVSANRDQATNDAAGGAKGSQHLHGNALDVDVSGMSKAERVRLISIASSMGFTGIGVYQNSLHFDMRSGSRAMWGPTHHGDSVPPWAFTVRAKHMTGAITTTTAQGQSPTAGSPVGYTGAPRSGFVSDVFAEMPPAQLQSVQDSASDLAIKSSEQKTQEEAVARNQAEQLTREDIAQLLQTGESQAISPADFDDVSVKVYKALGPEKYSKWIEDRAVAQRTHDLTADLDTMTPEAMNQRLAQLTPQGGENAAAQTRVYEAVQTKVNETIKARGDDPGVAIQKTVLAPGETVNWSNPQQVQDYLGRVEAGQSMLGMDRSLLPKAQAEQLGHQIRNVMAANPGYEQEATKALLTKMEQTFGNYTDDVFTQAVETMLDKDMTKSTRELMAGTVTEWAKSIPGMQDQSLTMKMSGLNEVGALDGQPNLETGESRSWWGWLTGAPEPAPPAPPPPENKPAPLAPPVTVDGVPPGAIDSYMKNANSMRIQNLFRKVYGDDAFKSMQKQLKERGMYGAAN